MTSAAAKPAVQIEASEGLSRTLLGYGKLVEANNRLSNSAIEKGKLARKMANLYAKEIRRQIDDVPVAISEMAELQAADVTSASLGTLSGTLVAQRTLQLFRLNFPLISSIYTDFGSDPAQFNQTQATRIVITPSIQSYNATAGADGRPLGWNNVIAAQTTDVLITLDEHIGVPIVFDANTLGETSRRLFDEQAPAASYALAKYFVEKIYKLITPANFNGYAVPSGAKVPVAYPTMVIAQIDMSRGRLADVAAILNPNEVPINNRFVLLTSPWYGSLSKDSSLVNFFAGQRAPEIVTDNELPMLAGFRPIEAPNLTNTNTTPNLVGFFGQKAGLVAKTRLPSDYTSALPPEARYGSVTTVTDSDTGMSVCLVQYTNHTGAYSEWRMSVMLGAAVGDKRGGLCLTSQ